MNLDRADGHHTSLIKIVLAMRAEHLSEGENSLPDEVKISFWRTWEEVCVPKNSAGGDSSGPRSDLDSSIHSIWELFGLHFAILLTPKLHFKNRPVSDVFWRAKFG